MITNHQTSDVTLTHQAAHFHLFTLEHFDSLNNIFLLILKKKSTRKFPTIVVVFPYHTN